MPRSHTEDDIITLQSLLLAPVHSFNKAFTDFIRNNSNVWNSAVWNMFNKILILFPMIYLCWCWNYRCIRQHQATDVGNSTNGGQITSHLLSLCSLLSVASLLFQFLYYHGGTIYVVASCVLIKDCSVIPGIT